MKATAMFLRFALQQVLRAAAFALLTTGMRTPMSRAIMLITTRSSMSVKPVNRLVMLFLFIIW